MTGPHCAIKDCSNGTYGLARWKKEKCDVHGCNKGTARCICEPPFTLFTFPTERKDPEKRKIWTKVVNRKNPSTGKSWEPTKNSRICSRHFVGGMPSSEHPNLGLHLGYDSRSNSAKKRKAPLERLPLGENSCKKKKLSTDSSEREEFQAGTPTAAGSTSSDHTYVYTCDCCQNCECTGCVEKHNKILDLEHKMENVTTKKPFKKGILRLRRDMVYNQFLKTDKAVKLNTGLPNLGTFEALLKLLKPYAANMRYWISPSRVISTKAKRKFVRTPKKSGPKRNLSVKAEFLLVLMKLRLALNNSFLASLFDVSASTCSSIINSWIKLLAENLSCLVVWPDKILTQKMLPTSLADRFPNLRCIIDCSETFINRPRDLKLQATTWSDYKHHNTLKYLVAIAPNGHISFISRAWGGRATDRHIVQHSGFLNKLDPQDLVMADRGFTIQEDLLIRGASLLIPPSSSGLQQMCGEMVAKTKRVANARIHVERAINRLKWFKIVNSTIPLSMLHNFNDILVICSALCNLLPPLIV